MFYNKQNVKSHLKNNSKPGSIPEGSQLKILENHEVSVGTIFNHLACAQILSSSISILSDQVQEEVFTIKQTPSCSARIWLRAILFSNTTHMRTLKDFSWLAITVAAIAILAQGKILVPLLELTLPGFEQP